ncbi:hypothetical protein [Neisseria sicca]|uniref:hypothetical protein n=1 Tax=Neisseria sicca TaxID=490 RepID=UPI00114C95A6|nr:hypothetical protein [Neisseria sicca]
MTRWSGRAAIRDMGFFRFQTGGYYSKRSSENRNRDFRRPFDQTGGLFVFCFFKTDDFQAEAGQAGEGGGLS